MDVSAHGRVISALGRLDVAAPRWSFRPKPEAAIRLASFWRKEHAILSTVNIPVNVNIPGDEGSGFVGLLSCRIGMEIVSP